MFENEESIPTFKNEFAGSLLYEVTALITLASLVRDNGYFRSTYYPTQLWLRWYLRPSLVPAKPNLVTLVLPTA